MFNALLLPGALVLPGAVLQPGAVLPFPSSNIFFLNFSRFFASFNAASSARAIIICALVLLFLFGLPFAFNLIVVGANDASDDASDDDFDVVVVVDDDDVLLRFNESLIRLLL